MAKILLGINRYAPPEVVDCALDIEAHLNKEVEILTWFDDDMIDRVITFPDTYLLYGDKRTDEL